jgi:NAD+ synthase (glutamine-hydrolysing)
MPPMNNRTIPYSAWLDKWASTPEAQLEDAFTAFAKAHRVEAYCIHPLCEVWSHLAYEEQWGMIERLNAWAADYFKACWAGEGLMASLQWNPFPADVQGNLKAVQSAMAFANALGVDMLVCPEQTLLGYPLRDMPLRFPKLVEDNEAALVELAKASTHTRVIIGVAEKRYDLSENGMGLEWGEAWGRPYYNSAFIVGSGGIQGVARKSLLPNYREFEEFRVFEPSPNHGIQRPERWQALALPHQHDALDANGCMTIHGQRVALSICEDVWEREPNQHPWYATSIVKQLLASTPDVLVNISASPSRCGKEARRHSLLSTLCKTYQTPLLYVNQVGGVDELIFDGASRLMNAAGEVLSQSAMFTPQFQLHHLQEDAFQQRMAWPKHSALPYISTQSDAFNPYDEGDLPRLYEALILGIRDFFRKCGFTRAVLGLSGGLDSAVNAVLLADALGAENVTGFAFPSLLTPASNQQDAETLARRLGIGWAVAPITQPQEAFMAERHNLHMALSERWGKPSEHSFATDNVQAIARATLLRLMGNDYNAFPIATSDKSEFYMGYTTVNGDMSGALAPLGDVCKTKVRALARWLNRNHALFRVIPEAVVERPSGADLAMNPETGQLLTAEEALMPYEFIDEIIWRIEAHGASLATLMATPLSWESQNGTLAPEAKERWLHRFFQRMQAASFKWFISPPTLLVDVEGSLVKSAYHHTITARRTRY